MTTTFDGCKAQNSGKAFVSRNIVVNILDIFFKNGKNTLSIFILNG